MNLTSRTFSIAGTLLAVAMTLTMEGPSFSAEQTVDLLYLENYKKNQMHYYGHLTDCKWRRTGRIDAEWTMLTKDNKREKVTFVERPLFNILSEELSQNGLALKWRIGAFNKKASLRPLYFLSEIVRSDGACTIRTKLPIAGRMLVLEYIHYELRGIADLESVTFYGQDADSGQKLIREWPKDFPRD